MRDPYFDTKEFRKKLKEYEEARDKGEQIYMDADDFANLSEYYHTKNDDSKAIEVAEYAVHLFPGAVEPLSFLSRYALLVKKDQKEAMQYADQIENKTDLDFFYLKAEIMIVNGLVEEADQYLKQQIPTVKEKEEDDDEDEETSLEDFYLDVSTLFADYDLNEKSQEWLDKCEDESSTDYRELEGRIAMGMGNYQRADQIYQQLLDEDPYASSYWNQLASAQFLQNDVKASIQSSEYAIAINPNDDEALLNKGNGLYTLGNYTQALKYFQRFLQLVPDSDSGELLTGITLARLNRPQEALIHMLKAKELAGQESPNLKEIYVQIAFMNSKLGHLETALQYIDEAMDLPGSDPAELTVLKGHFYMENHRFNEGKTAYRKAIDQSNSPTVFLHAAISFFENGIYDVAYQMLKTILFFVQDDWNEGYAYLAACAKALHKDDEYRMYVEIAAKKNPSETRLVLGKFFPDNLEPSQYGAYLKAHLQ